MDEKTIKQLIIDLLDNLDIKPQELTITKDETDSYQAQINLDDQDTGVLIGYHGDTIASLQLILGIMLYKQTGSWNRLIVNINDYRQKRQESLEKMAQDTAQKVKFSGEPIALFNLNPYERRIIHNYLNEYPEVATESQGEDKNRHLVVKLVSPGGTPQNPLDDNQPISEEQPQSATSSPESKQPSADNEPTT